MTAVLGEVTPYAPANALSPFGVVVAVLLPFTPRPRAAAGAFLAGWTAGIAALERSPPSRASEHGRTVVRQAPRPVTRDDILLHLLDPPHLPLSAIHPASG